MRKKRIFVNIFLFFSKKVLRFEKKYDIITFAVQTRNGLVTFKKDSPLRRSARMSVNIQGGSHDGFIKGFYTGAA